MSGDRYTPCGVCGRSIHTSGVCMACAAKADPWGNISKKLEEGGKALAIVDGTQEVRDSLNMLLEDEG